MHPKPVFNELYEQDLYQPLKEAFLKKQFAKKKLKQNMFAGTKILKMSKFSCIHVQTL